MCVAYPGRIVSVDGRHAQTDFLGNLVDVNISLVDAGVGDYILVHAGMAIQKVESEEAKDWIELFRDLEEMEHE